MASQFLEIDITTRKGAPARRNTEDLRKALDDLQGLKDVADQAASGADWTSLEELFGVPTGSGETYYNLLAGALAAINVSAVNSYIDRIG